MMRWLVKNLFILFLGIIVLIEGIGISFGRDISYFLTLILPLLLFIHTCLLKQKILVPKTASYLFFGFLFFSALSTISSLNVQKSFEYFIYFVALFIIFLYAYNYKKTLEKKLVPLIFVLSIFFTTYSIVVNSSLLPILTPLNGYQFVVSKFTSHNHLGDFLALPITLCIYYLFNRKHVLVSFMSIAYSLPFVFFSYSRSAYFSITLSTVFIYYYSSAKTKSWKYRLTFRIFIFGIIFSTLFFFIATTQQTVTSLIPQNINKYLSDRAALQYKDISGNRFNYFSQGASSIINRPLLGVGPFNFEYSSYKFTKNPMYWTTSSSHNIFIDIAAEHGLLAFIAFVAFIILIFSRSKKNALYFVALVMLINFQTDYTYRIYSFLLLFFVIAGTIYTEKEETHSKLLLTTSVLLVFFAVAILLSNYFQTNRNYREAFYMYPLNEKVYVPLINEERNRGNSKNALILTTIYKNLFSGNYLVFENLGYIYENFSEKKNALISYKKSLSRNFFRTPYLIEKVYYLTKEIDGKKSADNFIFESFNKLISLEHPWYVPEDFINTLNNICFKEKMKCPSLSR